MWLPVHRVLGLSMLGWFALVPALLATDVPSIGTELRATKRVLTLDASQREVETWIPFNKLLPGEEVTYTIACTNNGTAPASDVTVGLPIPSEMTLVPGDAPSEVELTASVDGGKTYAPLAQLRVVAPDGMSRPARPEDVGQLRWVFNRAIVPGETATVQCRARLK